MRKHPVLLLALGMAGCGGGGSPPDPSVREIALERYLERADGLCSRARGRTRRELRALQDRLLRDRTTTTAEVMRLNAEQADQARLLLADLEALPPPAEGGAEVRAYLRAGRRALAALDEAVSSFERGDVASSTEALARHRRLAPAVEHAARAAGLRECGDEFGRHTH